MKIVNLTPHAITVIYGNRERTFPSDGVARVSVCENEIGNIDGIPLVQTLYGKVEGLPDPKPDTVYIVSYAVLNALKNTYRTDCVAPNTGPKGAIRNEAGQIIATRGFQAL